MALLQSSNVLLTTFFWLWLCISSVYAGPYPIKGVPGAIHPRLELRTMHAKSPAMFNLYILALQSFQKDKESNKLSFYQIAGIHGQPNIPWDGVDQTADGTGYCVHDSTLFPTWHRPYVALYEQRLVAHARKIARKFQGPAKQKYMKLAKKLRAPYWDWAINPGAGKSALPALMTAKHLSVTTPNHGKQSVKNPLYSYRYHPLESQYYVSPWSTWKNTLRYPTSEAPNARSRNKQAARTLDAARAGTQATLYQFFVNCKAWLEMSNDNPTHTHPGCSTSLESIHNNIHGQIGGYFPTDGGSYYGGHMTVIPYSGHEPSFFLHHTNIDRLFAMWQALYPTHWVAAGTQTVSTFVIPAGTRVNKKTPLKPFHKNARGDFWNSDDVRKTQVFGYTYPELLHGGNNPKKMRAKINRLYGPNARAHAAKRDSLITPLIANNGSAFTWNVNIVTTRFKLGNSYNIYAFLGQPQNEDASTWGYDPNSAGSMSVFAAPGMEKSDVLTYNTIPLTDKLAEKVQSGDLPSLSESDVTPYLTKNLQFKILSSRGILEASDVPDFNATVAASTLEAPQSETDFGIYSPFVEIPHITKGLLGGILNSVTN